MVPLATSFEEFRPLLFSIAYRMTKSIADTEDILQDVYEACLQKNNEAFISIKHYLAKAVINRSLSSIEKRKALQYKGIDLPEPLLVEERSPILQSDVSFGLLTLLQTLTPQERAVFILKETFDFDYTELAELLDLKQEHCRQLLHRSKEKLKTRKVRRRATKQQNEAFAAAFLQASLSGKLEELIRFLKQDVVIYSDGGGKVSAAINPIYGIEHVVKFLWGMQQKRGAELELQIKTINGQPGFVFYDKETGQIDTIAILEEEDGQVAALYLVRNPEKFSNSLSQN